MNVYRTRRALGVFVVVSLLVLTFLVNTQEQKVEINNIPIKDNYVSSLAFQTLEKLVVKGRAPKTGYNRERFGSDWSTTNGCDTRNIILQRDLTAVMTSNGCEVISGILDDLYTGMVIQFSRGTETSGKVQIDHVVALSDAWQKGAQYWTETKRMQFANDPLELMAVDGSANQAKGDGDAATWLPPNKLFRCSYVARQVSIKFKYELWVTLAEYDAMADILYKCPEQLLPIP